MWYINYSSVFVLYPISWIFIHLYENVWKPQRKIVNSFQE